MLHSAPGLGLIELVWSHLVAGPKVRFCYMQVSTCVLKTRWEKCCSRVCSLNTSTYRLYLYCILTVVACMEHKDRVSFYRVACVRHPSVMCFIEAMSDRILIYAVVRPTCMKIIQQTFKGPGDLSSF